MTETLSWSQVSTLASCGMQYRLRYIERTEASPQGALIGGSAIHETIAWAEHEGLPQMFAAGGAFAEMNIRAAVEVYFVDDFSARVENAGGPEAIRWSGRKTKEFPNGENDLWWKRNGAMMLRRWLDIRSRDEAAGVRVLEGAVEHQVIAQLDSGQPVRGFIDATLAVDADGVPFVRDWKTGQPGGAAPLQLATYAWLMRAGAGIHVSSGEFGYLRQADIAKRLVRFDDLEPLIEMVPGIFEEHLQRRAAGVFDMSPSTMCSACNVKEACPYGRWLAGRLEAVKT